MRYLLLLCFLGFGSVSFSQLAYQDLSFGEALQKAKSEGKLLFVQFESTDCRQCNDVADKGLDNELVSKQIEQYFVPVRITRQHRDRNIIKTKYGIKGFGSLFIDADGVLLHSWHQSSTMPAQYVDQINLALSKRSESLRVNELESLHQSTQTYGTLELLMEKRKRLGLPVDDLLEQYVTLVPKDSANSAEVIRFLISMNPMLGTRAFDMMHRDQLMFSKVWATLPLPVRMESNSGTIFKTLNKAIETRDERLAMQTAGFAKQSWSDNEFEGERAFHSNLLRYYKETNDTANYLDRSVAYTERYLMQLDVNAIKRADSIKVREMLDKAPTKDRVSADGKIFRRAAVTFAPVGQRYAGMLNEPAWAFYEMTKDERLLSLATRWAKRATEFYESPEVLDTYAHLLYVTGKREEAITIQKKAISLVKQRGLSTDSYEDELRKMKKETPLN